MTSAIVLGTDLGAHATFGTCADCGVSICDPLGHLQHDTMARCVDCGVMAAALACEAPRKRAARPAPDGRSGAERSEKELAFFATSPTLAILVVHLADIRDDDDVLEPSAGNGALAVAATDAGGRVSCVEIHHERAAQLRRLGFDVTEADFLSLEPRPVSTVIMNPPFAARADAHHVARALEWLKPGGSLVAIVSGSFPTRSDAITVEVREEIARRGGRIEALPPGSFKSAGTDVSTALVIVPRAT